ncbi:MAG: putative toxin-antitoxin system toxin component, PIN family [Bacteroidaceae bacterium]|nr:putative toxin-antitoxin system toxin component, PIN family [Bacteroidaceae bacterium]
MYRVVLDTNCLLAILSSKSIYYHLWKGFQDGKYNLCVSNEILEEYQEIIAIKTNSSIAWNVIRSVVESNHVEFIDPWFKTMAIEDDQDDNKFVDCAFASNASFIVSNDSHFDVLNNIDFPRIAVMKLHEFSIIMGRG